MVTGSEYTPDILMYTCVATSRLLLICLPRQPTAASRVGEKNGNLNLVLCGPGLRENLLFTGFAVTAFPVIC